MSLHSLGLFEAFGVELEYMIVDRDTLNVKPISDLALTAAAGELTGEVELGTISWSNELVLHVLELKVTEPTVALDSLADEFQSNVAHANHILADHNACLLPTGMHPWMNPAREMKLWPHDYNEVYAAFNRIFNCCGQGWANLQSAHWNLPFRNDAEFAKLHAAIRLILPLLPGLAASSPIYEMRTHNALDCRLEVYRQNSAKIPSITGQVVPEAVYNEADYNTHIFQRMFRDIAPYDPDGTLQHIWLNARGAIARFDRGAIEIRVLDVQECPLADLAIGRFLVTVLKQLCAQRWSHFDQQSQVTTELLAEIFRSASKIGPKAEVPAEVAIHFGLKATKTVTVGDVWQSLLVDLQPTHDLPATVIEAIECILKRGTLAERILQATGSQASRDRIKAVYSQLAKCLANGEMFLSESVA